jgi:predicted MPP superfamily phosphohydrolase
MIVQAGLRWLARFAILITIILGILLWMFANARAMPLVRTAEVVLPWPDSSSTRPLKLALLTDEHLSGPDNDPDRMARIVDLINAQKPDLIMLGGDFEGDDKGSKTYGPEETVAPFSRLRAPMGVIAVPGNHDWGWYGDIDFTPLHRAFDRLGITVLQNEAVRRGPLVIGGLDYGGRGWPNVEGTAEKMRALGGAPVMMGHSPEVFPKVPEDITLMLAGHVHCGQIALPLRGPIHVQTAAARRYNCGRYHERERTLIVSAGVGTSTFPLRAFAPPDIWVVTVRPPDPALRHWPMRQCGAKPGDFQPCGTSSRST